jgi:hypothetical protein
MKAVARSVMLATLMAGVILWGYPAAAQSTDPMLGIWKINAGKSKFSPGPPLKGGFVTYAPTADGMTRTTAELIAADGTKQVVEYTATDDGKDHPITGMPGIDSVMVKKIDANTWERIDKKGGQVVGTLTRRINANGDEITVMIKGTNAQGQPVENIVVLEKYSP